MITIYECAGISRHTYKATAKNVFNLHFVNIEESDGKSVRHGLYYVPNLDKKVNPHAPFFAQLYIKFVKGRAVAAVIGVRGTVMTSRDNLAMDYNSYVSEVLGTGENTEKPKYTGLALGFYHTCRLYLRRHFPKLSLPVLTGHSIGGTIVKVLTLSSIPATSVSFNGPGCGHMPGVKIARQNRVYNIDSHYGFINKIGESLGHIYYINVPNRQEEAKSVIANFDLSQFEETNHIYQLSKKLPFQGFNDSQVRLGVNMNALTQRVEILTKSYKPLITHFPKQEAVAEQICEQSIPAESHRHWYQLKGKLLYHLCKEGGRHAFEVMVAQHSIANLMHALHQQQNVAVAHKMIS